MLELIAIAVDVLIAISYVVVGAGDVRRAYRPAAALLIVTGVLVLIGSCAAHALPLTGVASGSPTFRTLAAAHSLVRVVGAGVLAGTALILLAKRLERLRRPGPRPF